MILASVKGDRVDYDTQYRIAFEFIGDNDERYRNGIFMTPGATTMCEVINGLRVLADNFEGRLKRDK